MIIVWLRANESDRDYDHSTGLTTEAYKRLSNALDTAGFEIMQGPALVSADLSIVMEHKRRSGQCPCTAPHEGDPCGCGHPVAEHNEDERCQAADVPTDAPGRDVNGD